MTPNSAKAIDRLKLQFAEKLTTLANKGFDISKMTGQIRLNMQSGSITGKAGIVLDLTVDV